VASWPHFAACIRTGCWFDGRSGASQDDSLDLGNVVNSAAERSLGGAVDTPNYLRHGGTDHNGSENGFACSFDYVNSPESWLGSVSSLDAVRQLPLVESF